MSGQEMGNVLQRREEKKKSDLATNFTNMKNEENQN